MQNLSTVGRCIIEYVEVLLTNNLYFVTANQQVGANNCIISASMSYGDRDIRQGITYDRPRLFCNVYNGKKTTKVFPRHLKPL